jgi:Flp pilus assembly protein TadG
MKSEKGQAIVEMALTISLLLILLLGIIDFGRIFHIFLTLEHASREGVRLASVGGSDTEITDRVHHTTTGLDNGQLTITITPSEADRTRGEHAAVALTYPIDFLTPLIQPLVPDPFILDSDAVMRVEKN